MIDTKLFEIRDCMTLIPAIAIRVSGEDGPLARRAGYGINACVLLTYLTGGRKAEHDPYAWGDRTMTVAHIYMERFWHNLFDGQVIDVEHLLGETLAPKASEL